MYDDLTEERLTQFLKDTASKRDKSQDKCWIDTPIGLCDNGLYHIGNGCFTGKYGFEQFHEAVSKKCSEMFTSTNNK